MTNQNFGDVLALGGVIQTPISDLIITEKGTLRGMLEIPPFFLPFAPKDVECIQIASLNSVVDPHDKIELILGKCFTNEVVLPLDFGNHIVAHENDNLPIPMNFVHVGVASLNLGLIGAPCDLLLGHFWKIGLLDILHRDIIRVT